CLSNSSVRAVRSVSDGGGSGLFCAEAVCNRKTESRSLMPSCVGVEGCLMAEVFMSERAQAGIRSAGRG
ncbi:MAG: hypothetical protein ACK5YC_21555, partial [Planctomyces sp.]